MQISLKETLKNARMQFDTRLAEVLIARPDLSYNQIEKEFGISETVIRRVIKRFDIAHRKRGPKSTKVEMRNDRADTRSGDTMWIYERNEFDAWKWDSVGGVRVLTHTTYPSYSIDAERFRTLDDLTFWLMHLEEKSWITKMDLLVVYRRFIDRYIREVPNDAH